MTDDPVPRLEWSDRMLLGFQAMDDEHRDFVASLEALRGAAPEHTAARLDDFASHARRHFGAEDAWMTETGFPPRQCHIDEHAAVLKSVDEVRALVAEGRVDIVKSLADELARWFPGHATHLDSALAAWMGKRRWNAMPVVIRRNILDKTTD